MQIIAIGEAILDRLPHGDRVGGAPINVAGHIRQLSGDLGIEAGVVTRLGRDAEGQQILARLQELGLGTHCIQHDPARPTGIVHVSIDQQGQPGYHIESDAAWDFLEYNTELERLARNASVVCYGTLAQRSHTSRETIRRFLDEAPQAMRVLDVNLRQDFCTPATLQASLTHATFVKLSQDELPATSALLAKPVDRNDIDRQAFDLIHQFGLIGLALTRGPAGTLLYLDGERYEAEPICYPVAAHADAVGAGDAACAGLILGLLLGWPPEETLALANHIGGYVASQSGAIPQLPAQLRSRVTPAGFDAPTTGRPATEPAAVKPSRLARRLASMRQIPAAQKKPTT